MNGLLITDLDNISTQWLTDILVKSGALQHGRVAHFELESGSSSWSTNARLSLHYTAEALGEKPANLFLKMARTNLGEDSFDDSEVNYYTRDYVDVAGVPLVHCYDAQYSDAQQRYHLLLDDVTATHTEACNIAPTLEVGLALAEGLALMHANWWGQARLAEIGAEIHTAEHILRFVEIARPGLNHVLPRFDAQLKPHWPELIRRVFEKHPQMLIERAKNGNGFTLIHGDAGCYNILVPRQGDHPVFLLDRQPFNWSLTTWLGVYDLFYIMIMDWDPAFCREMEIPILQRYHARCCELGVSDYSWKQLWDDYRLCAFMGVYIALEYSRNGVNDEKIQYWLPRLKRSLQACDDLDCLALIK